MFNTRILYCGNCGYKNHGTLEGNKMDIICKNKECNVSIKTTFKSNNYIVSNYRYLDGKNRNFEGTVCSHCRCKHIGFLNDQREFNVLCECGNSIRVKKQKNGDIKITNKIY